MSETDNTRQARSLALSGATLKSAHHGASHAYPGTWGPSAERNFARRMKRERLRRDLRQEDLADRLVRLGVELHPSAMAKIEREPAPDKNIEPRMIRLNEAVAIARVFGLSVDDMLAEDDVLGLDEVERMRAELQIALREDLEAQEIARLTEDRVERLRWLIEVKQSDGADRVPSSDWSPFMDLQARRELRTRFMRWLYDAMGGATDDGIESEVFLESADAAGATAEDLRQTCQFLDGEYLIKCHWTMGDGPPFVQLRHPGVVEVEKAISAPDQGTEHFVPMVSVFHVAGSIINSQVSNASPGAQQSGTLTNGANAREFIDAARLLAKELSLGEAVQAELMADVDSIERELARPEPRPGVIREFGRSVRAVLEQAAGGIVATAASPAVMRAIDTISSFNS